MPEESVLTEKLNEKQSEVKFTEEELKQIQNIQKSYANITSQLGQVSIAKIRLQEQELSLAKEDEKIQEKFRNVQQEEQKFLDEITKKYGQGSLNPETGVFTPDKS
tara:strand:+ start:48 stop:365 length:318 start_codon:yes stop_codon:yes gene_type:complete